MKEQEFIIKFSEAQAIATHLSQDPHFVKISSLLKIFEGLRPYVAEDQETDAEVVVDQE